MIGWQHDHSLFTRVTVVVVVVAVAVFDDQLFVLEQSRGVLVAVNLTTAVETVHLGADKFIHDSDISIVVDGDAFDDRLEQIALSSC